MYLQTLIDELSKYNPELIVPYGFGGGGHSDRGYYENLAFPPMEKVSVGLMLACARQALGITIYGCKGGEFLVSGRTEVLIGEDESVCGEPITALLLRYMLASGYLEGEAAGFTKIEKIVAGKLEVSRRDHGITCARLDGVNLAGELKEFSGKKIRVNITLEKM